MPGASSLSDLWFVSFCASALITLNFCGFGWLRDAYRLPEYVRAANNEQTWSAALAARMRDKPKPTTYFSLSMGQVCLSISSVLDES
jgi:hypothetical protein